MKANFTLVYKNGNRKRKVSNMHKPNNNSTYFDYAMKMVIGDVIKEIYIDVTDNDVIIHRTKVKIPWSTYTGKTKLNCIFGITLCGERVVSEMAFESSYPTCRNDRKRYLVDVPTLDKDGNFIYDRCGLVTHKERCIVYSEEFGIKTIEDTSELHPAVKKVLGTINPI